MDQRKCEKSGQNVLDFKCKKILSGVEKPTSLSPAPAQKLGNFGIGNLETTVVCQTPEKTNEPLCIKSKEEEDEFLEKCKTIAELFNSMTCSLRLLSLCKKSPTFQNISTQVEVLAKRKFSYGHLAQIKYVLPEALQIDKILVHDNKTLCMKPDMKIALLFDDVEGHCEQSDFVALQQVFASRLRNFFATHPEACAIPEAILPEPFNRTSQTAFWDKDSDVSKAMLPEPFSQRSQTIVLEQSPAESSIQCLELSIEAELLSESSLLHPSFSRHFSKKVVAETEKTLSSPVPLSSTRSDSLDNQDIKTGQLKEFPRFSSKSDIVADKDIESKQPKESPTTCLKSTINPLAQLISPQCFFNSSAFESPKQRLASSVDSLMTETPAQLTPKRSMPSCDDKLKTMTGQNWSSCYKPAKRSLDFSHLECDRSAIESIAVQSEFDKVLHDNNSQTREMQNVEETLGCPIEDRKVSQSDFVMHRQMSACLPDIVALIHHIFQSANCSSVTKDELVHKIIMNNIDIVDRGEVEEQIELLEKLVPDWICKKLVPSGDILYNIKKVLDLDSVQARLIST